jgi:hypothetical protein
LNWLIVNVPIQLYRKTLFRAIEIENIRPDTMLTPEFPSIQLGTAQLIPQQVLTIGRTIAKFAATLLKVGMVLNLHGGRLFRPI